MYKSRAIVITLVFAIGVMLFSGLKLFNKPKYSEQKFSGKANILTGKADLTNLPVSQRPTIKLRPIGVPGAIDRYAETLEQFNHELEKIMEEHPNRYGASFKYGVAFAWETVWTHDPEVALDILIGLLAEHPNALHMQHMAGEVGRVTANILLENPEMAEWMSVVLLDTALNAETVAQRKAMITGINMISNNEQIGKYFSDWRKDLLLISELDDTPVLQATTASLINNNNGSEMNFEAAEFRERLVHKWEQSGDTKHLEVLHNLIKTTTRSSLEQDRNTVLLLKLLANRSNTTDDIEELLSLSMTLGIESLEKSLEVEFGPNISELDVKNRIREAIRQLKRKPVR